MYKYTHIVPPLSLTKSGIQTSTHCHVVLVRTCYAVYDTANLPTNIVDFRGLDPSRILNLRGGILMSVGDFLESLSQAMLVGIMLVGRLGAQHSRGFHSQRECALRDSHLPIDLSFRAESLTETPLMLCRA